MPAERRTQTGPIPSAPRRRPSAMAAGLLALGGFLVGVAGASDPKSFPDEWFFDGAQRPAPLKALEGKSAPALSIDKWIGAETSIAASKGKVVVVDFWATWCGPCMASIPHNVDLVKKYQDQGLVFIGVHDSNSGWDRADGVVKDKSINYPVGLDKGGASVKDFALQFWPTYVAIDKTGTIRAAGLTPDKVEEVVKALLAESGPEVAAAGPGGSEFPADSFVGGAGRPRGLREAEGKAAPRLKASAWIGKDPGESAMKGNVVVLTLVNPSLSMSLNELDKIAPLEKDLSSQGVVFLGVADGRGGDAGWKKVADHAKAKNLALSIARDEVVKKAGENGKPVEASATASALGVEFAPATVIIDRSGKVRAAGVKADKVKGIVEKLLAERVKDDAEKKEEKPK